MKSIIEYIRHNPGIVIIVLVALLLGYNTLAAILRNYELQGRVDRLDDEIGILELENNKLRYNNEYYKTDSYLEKRARESLNLRRPGEEVVIVPRRQSVSVNQDDRADEQPGIVERARANLNDWYNLFAGKSKSQSENLE